MNRTFLLFVLEQRGLDLNDLADQLGIKRDSLNRKIQGRSQFRLKEIKVMLKFLNMTFEELFINKEEKNNGKIII